MKNLFDQGWMRFGKFLQARLQKERFARIVARLDMFYKIVYETLPVNYFSRLPFWVQKEIASGLKYELVRQGIDPNQFLVTLLSAHRDALVAIGQGMFVGNAGAKPSQRIFSVETILRVWHAPEYLKLEETLTRRNLKSVVQRESIDPRATVRSAFGDIQLRERDNPEGDSNALHR